MRKLRQIVLLAVVAYGSSSACSSHGDRGESSGPEVETTDSGVVVAEQCQAVTSIEVIHRVNGSPVTDRLRLTPEANEDPELALRAFRAAANHYGVDNIISSRPISEVHCFAQTTAAVTPVANADDGLCADPTGIVPCPIPAASHIYTYGGTETCSVTNYGEAVSMSCEDSSAIVSKHGDVVLTINTQNLRADLLARTQALRKLVGDQNVITNFHFDIVITPDQQASIVPNQAFGNIAQQLQQARDQGQPLPDIGQILRNLPEPPQNVAFYTQLLGAYQKKLERLELMANVTNGALLSPQQVNAFYQNFVGTSKLIDKLVVQNSSSSLDQAAGAVNDTISQLATIDKSSTIYQQVKSSTQSLLDAQTSRGVFDPDRTLGVTVPDLYKFLTDDDIEKRLVAAEQLIKLNETIRRSDAKELVEATTGILGLMAWSMDNDDMDRVWRLYDQVEATEFFFDNDNPAGTSYDVHLTPEAQAMFNIDVQPNSAISYEVINLLNETADYNATTGKVTLDYHAIITVNARSALSTPDAIRALYHTEESYGVLDFLKDAGPAFVFGAVKELGDTAVGIISTTAAVLSDPAGAFEHLKSAVVNWRETLSLVWQQGADIIHRWPNMTVEEKAEVMGRLTTQLLLTFPPGIRGAGRMSEALEDAVRLHFKEAEAGLRIIERGGVALSEEAAVELAKRLERYEILATEDAVKIADKLDDALPCSLIGPGVHGPISAAGTLQPPCSAAQVAAAFKAFEARAAKMGVTVAEEVRDLFASTAKLAPPGRVIAKSLTADELAFVNRIVGEKGGIYVGPRQDSFHGIDGFYQGHPAQLKESISTSPASIATITRDAELHAKGPGYSYSELALYIHMKNLTRTQVIQYINGGPTGLIVGRGTIRSLDVLTSEGTWVHVENGFVQ